MNNKKTRIQQKIKKTLDSPFSNRRPNSSVIEIDPIQATTKMEIDDITIAFVTFNLDGNKYFDKHKTGIYNKKGELIEEFELLGIKEELINTHRKVFFNAINEACKYKANIICCTEMSYPFSKNKGQNTRAFNELQQISSENKTYIIAGTYHDFLLSSCNCCPIVAPNPKKTSTQYKLIPSRTKERHVRSASNMKILSYRTEFGKFCVSICYDAYSSDVKDLYRYSYNKAIVISHDFIFIPSYNKDVGGGMDHCRNIRDEAKAVVFFVNDLSHMVQPVIFLPEGGEQKADLRSESSMYNIYTYSLNLEKLRESVANLSIISPK